MTDSDASLLVVYDANNDFVAWWVRYLRRLRSAALKFERANSPPSRPEANSTHKRVASLRCCDCHGNWSNDGAAARRVIATVSAKPWSWLVSRNWLLARVVEAAMSAVIHRPAAGLGVAGMLWGSERHPPSYDRASMIFVRVLALIYVAAFVSLGVQIEGLVGRAGILPAAGYLDAVTAHYGSQAWLQVPSVFWLGVDDPLLVWACGGGAMSAIAALAGIRWRLNLGVCYLLYLSLFSIGQSFMHFQWDLLLLEAGFLAIFLNRGSSLAPILFRLLLFRFMFLSGCVKLLSGDPTWAALSALEVHFETQPLPSPLAWHAHHLPTWLLHAAVVGTFVIELVLPFLIFAPRRPRMLAASGFIVLQIGIALTGNYNFFNLLTTALILFLFEDGQLKHYRPAAGELSQPARTLLVALFAVLLVANLRVLIEPFRPDWIPRVVGQSLAPLQPFAICNSYGLFANMTVTRPEIEIEGTLDGRTWLSYPFRYKPGNVAQELQWLVPHQPRLDWQIWFAALAPADRSRWFGNLLYRLLQAEPTVIKLFAADPFAGTKPRSIRAKLYDYQFSTVRERTQTGVIWRRQLLGDFYPKVSLR